MTVRRLIAAPLLWAGALSAGAAQAQQAAKPCVPPAEAEALILNVAPQLLSAIATTCAPVLPANAHLRRPPAQLTAKFAADSARSWPLAKEALKKITGPDSAQLWDSELSRAMVGSMVGPLLTKDMKTSDCPTIDRVLTLIDPLPARNTAALIVTYFDLADRGKTRRGAFSVCPTIGK